MPTRIFQEGQQLELPFPIVRDAEIPREVRYPAAPRPRRRQDPTAMTVTELLVAVLGPKLEPACAELVASYGGLRQLSGAYRAELRDRGLSVGAIYRLSAIFEIARRFGEEEFVPGQPFRGSFDIYAHFRERLAAETQERFIAVLLDNKNRKLKDITVSLGSLTASIVHPRDVYAQVIRESAAGVIFVHNHPSGDPTPSKEDIEITQRLRQVGDLVGVRVLDHIVIGKGRYVSFVDDGYW